jgi:hypothetical protein
MCVSACVCVCVCVGERERERERERNCVCGMYEALENPEGQSGMRTHT